MKHIAVIPVPDGIMCVFSLEAVAKTINAVPCWDKKKSPSTVQEVDLHMQFVTSVVECHNPWLFSYHACSL